MSVLNGMEMAGRYDDSFCERVGFAVAALEYFVALEDSGFDQTQFFWLVLAFHGVCITSHPARRWGRAGRCW